MREKYESLSLATLKELAKARGLKGISTLRKPALIERMLQEDEKERKDTGAISETVQKEEIREEKKDRQEEHQTPVRQYRQNGHVQESRAFYDNRRKNNWQEGGTRTYNSASEGRRYGNSQSEFSKNHGSQNEGRRYGNTQGENFRMYGSQNEGRRYGNTQDENSRIYNSQNEDRRSGYSQEENPRTYNNQNEGRRSGYSQEENPRTYNNQNEDRRSGYSQEEIREPSAVRMKTEEAIYSRMMQRFRQKQAQLDSGQTAQWNARGTAGRIWIYPLCNGFLPGENDVYVSPAQIRRFNLKTGDILKGNTRVKLRRKNSALFCMSLPLTEFIPGRAQKRYEF